MFLLRAKHPTTCCSPEISVERWLRPGLCLKKQGDGLSSVPPGRTKSRWAGVEKIKLSVNREEN